MYQDKRWMDFYVNGSRAIVRVKMKNGGGHVFNTVQQDGKTIFADAQSGRIDCGYYFSQGKIKPSKTELVRVDNLEFTSRVGLTAKQREKTQ